MKTIEYIKNTIGYAEKFYSKNKGIESEDISEAKKVLVSYQVHFGMLLYAINNLMEILKESETKLMLEEIKNSGNK